jgi:p-hydroxybenzoate 3-monooxygenase
MHDVSVLCDALVALLKNGDSGEAEAYSERCLRRVWRAQDFSNYMTTLLHRLDTGDFDEKMQLGRLEYVRRSEAAAKSLAENYAGLPYGW